MQPHLATLDSRTDTPLTQESQDPEASFEVRRRMDLRDCEALMRTGSKSFFAASLVLPSRVRAPATALYAFCRLADDTIDLESHLYGGPMGALHHLQQRLQRIYDGRPSPVPADRALAAGRAHRRRGRALDHLEREAAHREAALAAAELDGLGGCRRRDHRCAARSRRPNAVPAASASSAMSGATSVRSPRPWPYRRHTI